METINQILILNPFNLKDDKVITFSDLKHIVSYAKVAEEMESKQEEQNFRDACDDLDHHYNKSISLPFKKTLPNKR